MTDSRVPDTPTAGDRIIRCPRCKVPAQQVWCYLYARNAVGGMDDLYDEADNPTPDGPFDPGLTVDWRSAHCQACSQKTIWRGNELVYPVATQAPPPHASMPQDVRELYDEAGAVLAASPRAGAALIRASLERLLKTLDAEAPKKAPLDDRVARLSGRVSKTLADQLDIIRHLGNSSLHGEGDDEIAALYLGDKEQGATIAALIFTAINDLVEELIARPAQTQEIWNKLPSGVRETIERKRAAAAKTAS